jgi:ubiquinone/menaquinone biosynthesis C-methylase UbiE
MVEIDLLKSNPKKKRNLNARSASKTAETVRISREYGFDYFDGDRMYGYGGYQYDGRWVPVARNMIHHFKLQPGHRILDVGCAKGFLVRDLKESGIDAYGIDISEYALENCDPSIVGRLHLGNAVSLPFKTNSFDVVISINTVHNLERPDCVKAIREIQRVSRGQAFIQVDSYRTPEEREVFESWVLTAKFHDYPSGWLDVFAEASYTGDWFWTIID